MVRAWLVGLGIAVSLHVTTLEADVLMGSNAGSPSDQIQLVSSSGAILAAVGPHLASAAAVDTSGDFFFAIPGDTSSTIEEYSSSLSLLSSFSLTPPSDTRASAGYVVDLGWGMGSLWASTYSGEVYRLSPTGAIQSSFDTGATSPGVTTNGTSVFTTSGLGLLAAAPDLYQRDTSGAIQATIDTGLNDTLGVGYDAATNSFWIGGVDVLTQVSSSGSTTQGFSLDGEHTGVEIGSVAAAPPPPPPAEVPEPSTALLVLGGGAAAVIGRSRIRHQRRS